MYTRDSHLRAEDWALFIFFASVTYDNLNLLGQASGTGSDLTLAKIATFAALGIFGMRSLFTKEARMLSVVISPTSLFAWLFIAVSMLSCINIQEVYDVPGNAGPGVILFRRTTLIILFYAIIAVARTQRHMDYILMAYIIGGLVTCYAGLYEMVTGEMFLTATGAGRDELVQTSTGEARVQGLEDDTNLQTTFLLFGIPFLYYFFFRYSGIVRLLVAGMLLLYVVSLIITGSMGGWIGLAMVIMINFLVMEGANKWKLLFASGFLGVVLFIVLGFQMEAVTIDKILGTYDSHSGSIRSGLIKMCWEMFKDHPFIGAGTAAFGNEYHLYSFLANDGAPNQPNPPLNAYLQVLAENGILGFIVFVALLGASLLELVTGLRNAKHDSSRMLGISLLCLYACLLWTLAIFPVMDGKYMWICIGLCVAYGNIMKEWAQPSPDKLINKAQPCNEAA